MIADLDQAPKERVEKPVWRVAFFGRLEERKGIKLFVDAVQVRAHGRTCSHMAAPASTWPHMLPHGIHPIPFALNGSSGRTHMPAHAPTWSFHCRVV